MARPKISELPTTADGLAKEVAKVRQDLAKARLDQALQKLASPATLRSLRIRLAQVLTMQAQRTATPEPVQPNKATS